MALVFARLVVDTVDKGVHVLVVPLKDASGATVAGVRYGEFAAHGASSPLVPLGWVRFYDVVLPRTALLNRLGGVDSKPAPLRALVSPTDGVRVVALHATLVALGNVVRTVQALVMEPRGQRGALRLELSSVQRTLMASHAMLLAAHVARNALLAAPPSAAGPLSAARANATCVVWMQMAAGEVSALAGVVGLDALLPGNGILAAQRDVHALLHCAGHPSLALQALAQALLRAFGSLYGGFAGAIRYAGRRVAQWLESNPVASRRTSADYLRSSDFQLRCLRMRVFALSSSLLESVALVSAAEVDRAAAWRANVEGAEQLACAYVQLVAVHQLVAAEAATSHPHLLAVLQRSRAALSLRWIADWALALVASGYMSATQSKAVALECGVALRELLVDCELLVHTTRDDAPSPPPAAGAGYAERLLQSKL